MLTWRGALHIPRVPTKPELLLQVTGFWHCVPTKSRFAPFTAVPRSACCLLKRSILGQQIISESGVYQDSCGRSTFACSPSHFGSSVLRHQTAGSQPGGSEPPLSSGRVALSWMDWTGYNVHICYIHICSYYVILEHTLCIVTVWYRCIYIYVYTYIYTYIYTYYNMYGECIYIYTIQYIIIYIYI